MEDVLCVYQRPYDPNNPMACVDEKSVQLIGDARDPLPIATGRAARVDYEYRRKGTANLFLAFEPLANWRDVQVTERRTKKDWAAYVKHLVDGRYKDAHRVVLVMDNLNTHTPASLYEAFEPSEAKRIADKLEIHVCAQTRKLAQHGGDRTERAGASSATTHRRPSVSGLCGQDDDGRTKPQQHRRKLAVRHQGCTDQTETTLSFN